MTLKFCTLLIWAVLDYKLLVVLEIKRLVALFDLPRTAAKTD